MLFNLKLTKIIYSVKNSTVKELDHLGSSLVPIFLRFLLNKVLEFFDENEAKVRSARILLS